MMYFIDDIFKILNLALRIALIIFIIRRYLMDQVKKMIHLENQDLQVLMQHHMQLRQSCAEIEKQMKHDEKIFEQLKLKFELWNQLIAQKKQQEIQLCLDRQKKREILIEKKIEYLQHRRLIEKEVPQLLDNVAKTLQKEFLQNVSLGKKYRTKVLQALHE